MAPQDLSRSGVGECTTTFGVDTKVKDIENMEDMEGTTWGIKMKQGAEQSRTSGMVKADMIMM